MLLGFPVVLLYVLKKNKGIGYLGSVLGFSQPVLEPYSRERGGRIMIHCVSVGEAMAVESLVKELKERFPRARLVMTVTTKTGYETACRYYSSHMETITYFPWDLQFAIRAFMKKVKPDMIVIMETELWPGLLYYARRNKLPVFLVNARLSEKTARIYKKLHFFWKNYLPAIQGICAQDETEVQRFTSIGLASSRVFSMGNIKFDNPGVILQEEEKEALRHELLLKKNDFTVILGSTHRGEEEMLLGALTPLLRRYPRLKFLVVPRHPDRVPEVEEVFRQKGWQYTLRSQKNQNHSVSLILVDTLGELARLYNISEVGIIGGSFVSIGGHNILEPAAAGCYPVFGPYMFKQKPMLELALRTGGGYQCENVSQAVQFLENCLEEEDFLQKRTDKTLNMVKLKKSAAKRMVNIIEKNSYLSGRKELQ